MKATCLSSLSILEPYSFPTTLQITLASPSRNTHRALLVFYRWLSPIPPFQQPSTPLSLSLLLHFPLSALGCCLRGLPPTHPHWLTFTMFIHPLPPAKHNIRSLECCCEAQFDDFNQSCVCFVCHGLKANLAVYRMLAGQHLPHSLTHQSLSVACLISPRPAPSTTQQSVGRKRNFLVCVRVCMCGVRCRKSSLVGFSRVVER